MIFLNFFSMWCTFTPLTAPHPLPSILSLNTISSNRIIFWILRCHHAERKNKFNWDTTGVELQQRLCCTWSLYIATLHKCHIPTDVQWIGNGKFITQRTIMSFVLIPGNLLLITSLGKFVWTPGIFNANDFPYWNIPCPTTRKEFGVFYTAKSLVFLWFWCCVTSYFTD